MELNPIHKIISRFIARGIHVRPLDAVRQGKLKRSAIFRTHKMNRCKGR